MKRHFFALLFSLLFVVGGVGAQPREQFPYVAAPIAIADEVALAEWYAHHFWDAYDFSAAETKYAPEVNKQGFVNFIAALYATSPEHSATAIGEMMQRAARSEDGYWCFLEMAEIVLYDPSSPMRNDLLWEMFLHHAVSEVSPLDEVSKSRYVSMLKLVSRNQQGQYAVDFVYTRADGSQGRLYDIMAPFTVIYFYNPGCGECARVKAQIEALGHLDILHERGVVEVLALHPDEDLTEWRRKLSENPDWWITAYDKGQQINRNELYDLKAIPTIYLLDAQKRVVMKDPTVEAFLVALGSMLR